MGKNSNISNMNNLKKKGKLTNDMILEKFSFTFTRDAEWFKRTYEMVGKVKEDLDKKLYESKNLDSSLKPYDQNEVYRVELEEAAKRSRRESGANILIPVNIYDREITSQVMKLI